MREGAAAGQESAEGFEGVVAGWSVWLVLDEIRKRRGEVPFAASCLMKGVCWMSVAIAVDAILDV